jgi:NADPH:quinone reductase-like Zn-dependent oxidoreductase
MVAVRFENFGEISEVLKTTTIEGPKPRRGEVLVRVAAAAINPSDAKNVLGQMPGTSLPRTPGRDFASVIVEASDAGLPLGTEVGAVEEISGSSATVLMPSSWPFPPKASRQSRRH